MRLCYRKYEPEPVEKNERFGELTRVSLDRTPLNGFDRCHLSRDDLSQNASGERDRHIGVCRLLVRQIRNAQFFQIECGASTQLWENPVDDAALALTL